jgi:hypothetical protein
MLLKPYSINISSILLLGLMFGLIFNAPLQYFVNPLRLFFIFTLFIGMFLVIKSDLTNGKYLSHYFLLLGVLILGLISLNIATLPLNIAIRELYANLSIVFGFFAFRYYEKFKSLLVYAITISLIIMIYDIVNLEYLFNFDPVQNRFQVDRGKGLFSYSKEAGAFTIFATFMFRDNPKILSLLFLTSILSGSRSAIIFIFIIIFMDIIFYSKNKISLKNLKFFLFGALIIFLSSYLIDDHLYARMENSFDFGKSGTHSYRFFIWDLYLKELNLSSTIHILFGNLGYFRAVLGNGAENAYLTILTHGGIFLLVVFYLPILFLAILSVLNFRMFYPFILLLIILQFGRQGTGWADGVLLWAYIFHIYSGKYMRGVLMRVLGRKFK